MGSIAVQLAFLLTFFYPKSEETRQFEVLHKGKPIGSLKATKSTAADLTTYINTTSIQAKVVKEVKVNFTIKSVYKGKLLEQSTVDISLNGKPYASTKTKRVGEGYQFYKDGELKKTISGNISYSAARMIFDEPKGFLNAFSEEKGNFDPIEKNPAGHYEKLNSRGRKSTYRYADGLLHDLGMDLGVTEIEMILSKD
ncbi:MAG: hypothetical protein MUC59_03085 [Saprospiraceae bacterium]|jgi:hypothetical protein|nr:hypothetical protein [Saprospiraceae bacterium]